MRIAYFSDPHGKHEELTIPLGDILICGGDLSNNGTEKEIIDFFDWFQDQPHYYKVLIAGNHDRALDYNFTGHRSDNLLARLGKYISKYNLYLENQAGIIEGIRFWGSPNSLKHKEGYAFTLKGDREMRWNWHEIPKNTNILITHGPARFQNDWCDGEYIGCRDLLSKIEEIKPRLHLHGHVHESYGVNFNKDTTFINGSVLNEFDELVNKPYIIDYETARAVVYDYVA